LWRITCSGPPAASHPGSPEWLSDLPPERPALERVAERPLERHLHRADRSECHQQTLPLEVGHDQVEALVFLAEQVFLWHEHIVKRDQRGIRRVPAKLLERARLHPGPTLDDQERETPMAALLGRLHSGDEHVGAHAAGDERL
jgi:hypothetical protein